MSDRKPKILIVHNYYQIPGGEDTVVANEKKLLESHGHEVVLYTRHNSELKSLSKVQKLLLPVSTIFNYQTYKEVKKLILAEKINIMHVHNTLNIISPSVYYAAFSCRIPVVQTIHNFRLLCPGATFFRDGEICEECLKKGLLCAVKHKCYRGSRIQTLACVLSSWIHRAIGTYRKLNYICLTEFNKEKILNLKQIQESKVFIKPNFVTNNNIEKTLDSGNRKNQMIYVGRLEEIKGVDILLEAWRILGKDAPQLIMCGTGPMMEWCREYVEKWSLANVTIAGFVENEKVRQMIAESQALILPTQVYEGFPMTILEAMSVGTPVIGAHLGNVGTLVKENVNGICFDSKSAEDLACAVRRLNVSYDSVLACYEELYSPEANYNTLKGIYESVTACTE